ncbi:MAG: phosphoribosyltransferase family protein [Cyclobacteriaceae bacterium]
MTTTQDSKIFDSRQAGQLLSKKLREFENTDAVVLSIPRDGVIVGSAISEALNLALDVFPCKKLIHPGDSTKRIGAISKDEIFVDDNRTNIPQDYVSHQISLLRNVIRHEYEYYHHTLKALPLKYKTVIIMDDLLKSGNTMRACIRSIKKQKPLRIIVAVAFVSAEAIRAVGVLADQVVFLRMGHEIKSDCEYFTEFLPISESGVKQLLAESRNELQLK